LNFHSKLSSQQRALEDAIIMFSVKGKGKLGKPNKYVAECFLRFSEIGASIVEADNIPQIHLTLNKPKNSSGKK
jgi:hypothetical protein